jgi:hypothetical protein
MITESSLLVYEGNYLNLTLLIELYILDLGKHSCIHGYFKISIIYASFTNMLRKEDL